MRFFIFYLLLGLSPLAMATCLVTFSNGQTLQVREANENSVNDYELSIEQSRSFRVDGRYIEIKGVRFQGRLGTPKGQQYIFHVLASQIRHVDCTLPYETVLRLHGSNTIGATLAPALAKAFLADRRGQNIKSIISDKANEKFIQGQLYGKTLVIKIHAHGSSTAFGVSEKSRKKYPNDGLLNGQCDIGMASRKIKQEEKVNLQNIGIFAKHDKHLEKSEHVLALDGLPIIVHSSNPVSELSIAQISQIFSGQIRNWSEVGGQNGLIIVHARDDNSGTYDTFKNLVLKPYNVKLTSSAKRHESNQKLSEEIARTPNAIGFTGLPYIFNNRALKVSDGSFAIAANEITIGTEDYPLSRRLYLYTSTKPNNPYVDQFIEFVLSETGQKIVQQEDFVSLNLTDHTVKPPPISSLPQNEEHDSAVAQNYLNLTSKAKRISTTFRFQSNSQALDTRGLRDLHRMAEYLQKPKNHNRRLFLLGFTDSKGSYNYNKILSFRRAKALKGYLQRKNVGIEKMVMCGFAEEYPVASNQTEIGRQKNRRVEVWIE